MSLFRNARKHSATQPNFTISALRKRRYSLCDDLDRIAGRGKPMGNDSGLTHGDVRGICGA